MLLALSVLCVVLEGFVLKVLWGWFVAGYFGVPELTIPVAVGISFMVSLITYQTPSDDPEKEKVVAHNLAVVGIAFIGGAIAHMFM